jgi:dCTP deaminase
MFGLLTDAEIHKLAQSGMIDPFCPQQIREKDDKRVISYGLGSSGYDIRLGQSFMQLSPQERLDPKNIDMDAWVKTETNKPFWLAGNNFILGESVEIFDIPEDVTAIALGKSKLARCGIFVNITPLEPGWKGILTIEVANLGESPVLIYPLEGIAQLLFYRMEKRPYITYEDRNGVYQNQKGIELAKL